MKVTIVGTGYVGLVTGACFADLGIDVTCLDTDIDKIDALKTGVIPIYEPGLDEIVERAREAGRLSFTSRYEFAIPGADVVFIAVGTPPRPSDGQADLSAIMASAATIAPLLCGFTVVATKSTVPVGTSTRIEKLMRRAATDADFAVASNPEFLREGAAIRDFTHPDRVVLGVDGRRAAAVLREVYAPIEAAGVPVLVVDRSTAEIAKYAANSFLATKIAFINEVADLCESTGGSVDAVAHAIGLDHRIGPEFLKAGPGFGGSCFPKDTQAFVVTSEALGVRQRVVAAAIHANEARKLHLVERVVEASGGSLAGLRVAVLGLTFKAGTDDLRDSPSLVVVPELATLAAEVRAHDPAGLTRARGQIEGAVFCADMRDALDGADVTVVLTDWPEYKSMDFAEAADLMSGRVLVDLRNALDTAAATAAGFSVFGVGRSEARGVAPVQRMAAIRQARTAVQAAE